MCEPEVNRSHTLSPDGGYRETELGLLPSDWRVVRLGEVIKQRKEFFRVEDNVIYKRPRVQVRGQGIVLRDFINGASLKIKHQQQCRAGEFLVAEIDAKVGGFGVVPPELDGAIVSSHYFLFQIGQCLDRDFLSYYIKMPSFQRQVEARGSTNYASIRPKHVLEYLIPLPPLPEQLEIARVLRAIQRDIDATQEVIAAARELRKSLMHHLFTYGPVPIDRADQVPLKETEIGPVPEHWQVVRLGTIVSVKTGPFGSQLKKEILRTAGFKVYEQENVIAGDLSRGNDFIDDETYERLNQFRVEPGDVLLSRVGSFGRVLMVPEGAPPGIIGSRLLRLRIADKVNLYPSYLVVALKSESVSHQFSLLAHGVVMKGLNSSLVTSLFVPIPPLPEQLEIARVLSVVDRKIEAEEGRKRALEELFRSMLHHLMTGKLRVRPDTAETQPEPSECQGLAKTSP